MCGDHEGCYARAGTYLGSPPHVRGPRQILHALYIAHGITPACAGTTCPFRGACYEGWDHPRMCGDHGVKDVWVERGKGSPPHVRGPPRVKKGVRSITRITPACAGTTANPSINWNHKWDHPRMCGDHWDTVAGAISKIGSPPHVRGPHINVPTT